MSNVKYFLILFLFWSSQAFTQGTWKPFEFKPGQVFSYKILEKTSQKTSEMGMFYLQVEKSSETDLLFNWKLSQADKTIIDKFESTNSQLSAKILVRMMLEDNDIAEIIAKNLFAPTFEIHYRNLDLKSGESSARHGGKSRIVIGDLETVAGIEGYHVQYFEKDQLIFTHVINQTIPLPLKIVSDIQDDRTVIIQLLQYQKE